MKKKKKKTSIYKIYIMYYNLKCIICILYNLEKKKKLTIF